MLLKNALNLHYFVSCLQDFIEDGRIATICVEKPRISHQTASEDPPDLVIIVAKFACIIIMLFNIVMYI